MVEDLHLQKESRSNTTTKLPMQIASSETQRTEPQEQVSLRSTSIRYKASEEYSAHCYAQLRLSQDSQESSVVDFCASLFGSLWCHGHMPCTCTLIFLLFCFCVCCTSFLVLNPPFHNSKIPSLKTVYITHTSWEILWCTRRIPKWLDKYTKNVLKVKFQLIVQLVHLLNKLIFLKELVPSPCTQE